MTVTRQSLKFLPYLVLYGAAFLLQITQPNDYDLGWHLKYGEYIARYGHVLRTNTFSSVMTEFRWVNSTSGTDLLTYVLYHIGGFPGLAIAAAVLGTLTLIVFAKAAKLSFFQQSVLVPAVLMGTMPLWRVSFRGQLVSIFLLGILSLVLRWSEQRHRLLWLLPPFFLIWTNLHGQVIVGLGVLAVWLTGRYLQESQRSVRKPLALIGLCTAATAVNPYGAGVFTEFIKYIGNPGMNQIQEWTPLMPFSLYWSIFAVFAFLTLIAVTRLLRLGLIRRYFSWVLTALLFMAAGMLQRRYLWMFYMFSLPLLATLLPSTVKRHIPVLGNYILLPFLGVLLLLLVGSGKPLQEVRQMSWDGYCAVVMCPTGAVSYLQTHPWRPPLYTYYNWGGWLIWHHPDIKPSMDGRMPLWRDEHGYSAYAEYLQYINNIRSIDESAFNTVMIPVRAAIYDELLSLEERGRWLTLYEDETVAIFVRTGR